MRADAGRHPGYGVARRVVATGTSAWRPSPPRRKLTCPARLRTVTPGWSTGIEAMSRVARGVQGKTTVDVDQDLLQGRRRIYLVSYPRSGNTLLRAYFSLLQGRAQPSIYPGDVVGPAGSALTDALDDIVLVKSHEMPAGDDPVIYLVRDGRNATLSFLYMAFLFGGHRFSRLDEVHDGIRHLDATEGSWAAHVADALRQATRRRMLFLRYEDLMRDRAAALAAMAHFAGAAIPAATIALCIARHAATDRYAENPYNGFLFEPERQSIYDLLKRHRRSDYWRHILDARSKRYFHDSGATDALLRFAYERSADWWRN